MTSDSCVVKRLLDHQLEIVFPSADEMDRLHQIILDELSNNIFTKESVEFYVKSIQRLSDEQQVEGVVLGCTGKHFRFNFQEALLICFLQKFLY